MKAVLQAGWLLTVAVGNIIVLIVAEAGSLSDQVYHMNCSIFWRNPSQMSLTVGIRIATSSSVFMCCCSGQNTYYSHLSWWPWVSSFQSWLTSTPTWTRWKLRLNLRSLSQRIRKRKSLKWRPKTIWCTQTTRCQITQTSNKRRSRVIFFLLICR